MLPAFMELKAGSLGDGRRVIDIEGDGVFDLAAQNGCVSVTRLYGASQTELRLSHLDAQRAFFSLPGLYDDLGDIPHTWRSLLFGISSQDCF